MFKINRKISTCSDFWLLAELSPKKKSGFYKEQGKYRLDGAILTFIQHLPGTLHALSHLLFTEKTNELSFWEVIFSKIHSSRNCCSVRIGAQI